MSKGMLVVISGFSGVGKGTIVKELVSRYDNYVVSVSATTRNPRPGEEEGVSYFFKTDEEFEKMIENNELIEHAGYVGHYYGTPRAFVEKNLDDGKDVILEIEVQGAMNVKKQYDNAVLIFVTAPGADVLRERLVGRGTETEDVINRRMERAAREAESASCYDYVVVNDNLEECVETVDRIVKSAHNKTSERIALIDTIRKELAEKAGI